MKTDSAGSHALQGLRAAVLGSTSGIGRAVALALAEAGADVIIHGRSQHEAAQGVAAEVRSRGGRAHVLMADLADRAAGDRLVDDAWAVWDGLDAWLHIAGADTLTGRPPSSSFDEKLDRLWAVDVVATIRLCRAIGQRMKAHRGGSIVTMGWDQAETGMEGDSGELFAATKGAIMAFTRSLALSPRPERPGQRPGPRLDQDRLGRVGFVRLARAGPPRDSPGPLGHARRRRPRRPLPGRPRRRLPHRPGPPRQRRGDPVNCPLL